MPFMNEILGCTSLSIVGMGKNCGKTECLNYILRRLPLGKCNVCVTSVGLDGEGTDQVTHTSKPEIYLREGMYFSTSEYHYRKRMLVSEIMGISDYTTALGRVITAKTLYPGKVLLSGPSTTASLKRWMDGLGAFGITLSVIDGALSRMSSASPALSESMILATGAALSSDMQLLVARTAFAVGLICLPEFHAQDSHDFSSVTVSAMSPYEGIPQGVTAVYVSGALTDSLLERIGREKALKDFTVVIKDFTRAFFSMERYAAFRKAGGTLAVECRSRLIAICVNPVAPNGYRLDSDRLCSALALKTGMPVYDLLKRGNYEA